MDREDTIEKEQAGEERARTQVLRAQETGTDYKSTMGQAAALTGGYGSSYSQAVGQEQYGAYLEKLGNVMPQLYSAAYSRYKSGKARRERIQQVPRQAQRREGAAGAGLQARTAGLRAAAESVPDADEPDIIDGL